MSCIVVGISGASGSGKTQLATRLASALGDKLGPSSVGIICEDYYYKDQSSVPMDERIKVNYDHPLSLEHDLLILHLNSLKAGKAVGLPQYDYCIHTRSAHTIRMEPKSIIIVEGILLFSNDALRAAMDYLVFTDTPLDICLIRRAQRDIEERGRSFESVIEQYQSTVRPMYFEFIHPSKQWADLIVPSWKDNTVAIDMLGASIRERLC